MPKRFSPLIYLLALFMVCFPSTSHAESPHEMTPVSMGTLTATLPDGSYEITDFVIAWDSTMQQLTISNTAIPDRVLWASVPGEPFLATGIGVETVEEARGYFFFDETRQQICADQSIDAIEIQQEALILTGSISDEGTLCRTYSLTIMPATADTRALSLAVELTSTDEAAYNRLYFTYQTESEERFFGFGTQFSFFDARGLRLPLWVSEQGIGRGAQPITNGANLAARAGGDYYTTYAPVPHTITSAGRSIFIQNTGYTLFDLTAADSVQVEVWSNTLNALIYAGATPAELIEIHTAVVGRMPPLPEWITAGAVVGIQGGTESVQEIYAMLQETNAVVGGFWLQDWVGRRTTSFGEQLWWNWELDDQRYPDWDSLVSDFAEHDIRTLIYFSPFLTDASDKPNVGRNLYAEAAELGYLVTTPEGEPYDILITDFSAALIDLTNPDAVAWYTDVLVEQIEQTGASGWMADFGEGLPYDAVLYAGDARELHNVYPVLWAAVNANVAEQSGLSDDAVYFIRAGYSASPGAARLFWLGDQLVDWHEHDGLKSAITGLLTSGLSGFSFNHSDIGGYTAVDNPILSIFRTEELLLRWMDANAFSVVFRTHEGNLPVQNAQFYDSEVALAHFARMSQVYAAWEFYRRTLIEEASQTGLPVVRHPFIHFPDDPNVYDIQYEQFMVGDQLMIAPVLDPETETVSAYLPAGDWVHLWSGDVVSGGQTVTVNAPLGEPGVFYPVGSAVGEQFAQNLRDAGLLD